ncbi:hypothetical protein [Synechococcus sp. PCC 6312]|uniref:hypothetical protein n=1 Tax=Synechococcus sp. (strain ATCC 27167 / PCC 6312) TaxID=195253 RepID=UPI00029F2C5D|nr:hypothetical protein [Synechococcus sp. PCC 6312]AFY59627.1 hypothetical protein Syn6312_0396 [Synechococcus sp. PCC 6312]
MQTFHTIHCPNCGRPAERYFLHLDRISRTQCPSCDYFMVQCLDSGRVIEAYAPGLVGKTDNLPLLARRTAFSH